MHNNASNCIPHLTLDSPLGVGFGEPVVGVTVTAAGKSVDGNCNTVKKSSLKITVVVTMIVTYTITHLFVNT